MPVQMLNSVSVGQIPASAPAVAGYVRWLLADVPSPCQQFPHAYHLSIAVNAGEDAECLDIERGDAEPYQAPAWVKRQLSRGAPAARCSKPRA